MKPFTTGSEDNTFGLVGKRSELRTKNEQDPVASPKAPKYKFTVGTRKGKEQEKSSTSGSQQEKEQELEEVECEDEPINVDHLEEQQEQEEEEFDEEDLPKNPREHKNLRHIGTCFPGIKSCFNYYIFTDSCF